MEGDELVQKDTKPENNIPVDLTQSLQQLASTSTCETSTLHSEDYIVKENFSGKGDSPSSTEVMTAKVDKLPGLPSPIFTLSSPVSESSSALSMNVPQSIDGQAPRISCKQRLDVSPDGKKYLKYQSPGKTDMRHQLLVQRTFSPHNEKFEPRTSSPMRKVRAFESSCGCSPIRSTPSTSCSKDPSQNSMKIVPFVSPNAESAMTSHDVQAIFKTPIRAQHPGGDNNGNSTPSRRTLSLFSSPAGSGSCLFTPGRQFINPFEMDTERLNMPPFSPSIFNIGSTCNSAQKNNAEGFWSVEQAALMMPVNIKDSDVQRQLRYQQKIDREHDDKVQSAANAFFSNALIVPSPWGEKVNHFLPRTPGSTKSVSCQTTLSVPPDKDLLSELQGKYGLPENKADSSPLVDAMGSSFIRRKLLNQLNDNDNEILSSPVLPVRKQSTPEWEQQTPNKHSSGHFSSSPIREEPDEKGHHPAMSESELLASPELSPVAGSRSNRFSGLYYSDQDMENPRAIMQLDFSSILEDDSGDEEEAGDKLGTLIQQTAVDNQPSTELSSSGLHISTELQLQASLASSQDDEVVPVTDPSSHRPLLYSGLSVESVSDTVSCSTSVPQLGSSQDTGYYTTSLLQSTTNLAMTSSNSLQIDGGTSSLPEPLSCSGRAGGDSVQIEIADLKHKSDSGNDINCLGYSVESIGKSTGISLTKDDAVLQRKQEPCLVRKIRALSDVRLTREKRNVSRDLTQSFNMDSSARSDELRHSLSEYEQVIVKPEWRGKQESMDTGDFLNISLGNLKPSDHNSFSIKILPAVLSTPSFKRASGIEQNSVISKDYQTRKEMEPSEAYFQSRFSLGDDDTLEQARQLLGKSEQLRQRHSQLELVNSSPFQQALMASDENIDPDAFPIVSGSDSCNNEISCTKNDPMDVSSATPRILESIERNINSVGSPRLGSEIAAEILKRAGDDLAKVTDVLEDNS